VHTIYLLHGMNIDVLSRTRGCCQRYWTWSHNRITTSDQPTPHRPLYRRRLIVCCAVK